ncbi:hypothetical protein HNR46_002596 [Haloferula luteola]|uniref:Uncharacterized protein n=1 Tax=Haloferula luteola TaxID=595692 RepID=A0A840VHZ6_9BACT|nr:hypothetical protein [Haloferula luteola]MBB5352351.1 hypothetical protein [Haloferula luteola]
MIAFIGIAGALVAQAGDFRHIGDFTVQSRIKIAEGQVVRMPVEPLVLSAFTDGISVRISTEGDPSSASEYVIYRSDGIGRQRGNDGALEVLPGVQATCERGGVLRQLRLTEETLTITSFPGISNQTVIIHAVMSSPPRATPVPAPEDSAQLSPP